MRGVIVLVVLAATASAEPRVELEVRTADLVDGDAVARRLHALEPLLAACWQRQIAAVPHVTRGDLLHARKFFRNGSIWTSKSISGLFDSADWKRKFDRETLATCSFAILELVPVTPKGPRAEIEIHAALLP
jgi:hypothetical protein